MNGWMNEHSSSKAQVWPTGACGWWVPYHPKGICSLRPQARLRLTCHLQVLLTGKPCRNSQVLVAYSMLQMVREQVLQESMTGDDILLVRTPLGRAPPHQLVEAPTIHTIPGEVPGLQRPFCPWAGVAMRADILPTLC